MGRLCGGRGLQGRYTPDDKGWGRGNRPLVTTMCVLGRRSGDLLIGQQHRPAGISGYRRRRSGSMRPEPGAPRSTVGNSENSMPAWQPGRTDFSWRNKSCSDGDGKRTAPVGSYSANSLWAYMTCTATCGSGHRIAGMTVTPERPDRRPRLDDWGLQPARDSGRFLVQRTAVPAFRQSLQVHPLVPLLQYRLPPGPGQVDEGTTPDNLHRTFYRDSLYTFPFFPFPPGAARRAANFRTPLLEIMSNISPH